MEELKEEDFKNNNLPADCSRFDILLAVAERASSLYDEGKKKEKDSKCNSSILKIKLCSAEPGRNCCLPIRKDDDEEAFCFKTGPKNRRVFEGFPIRKRPSPIEDSDGINYNDEVKSKKKRKICSSEKSFSLIGSRKGEAFCVKAGSGFNVLPNKKRPLPIEDINNDEIISKKKRKQATVYHPRDDLGMINYISPIEILVHQPLDHQLPLQFKESLISLNQGMVIEKEILVIEKALTATDVSPHQNRFSIPLNRVMKSFLNDDENKILGAREENGKMMKLEVNLIDPMRKKRSVKLGRWVMNKDSKKKVSLMKTSNGAGDESEKGKGGGASISYVINGPWAHIVDSNQLKEGDVMQLWAVRVEGSLWFLLVKLQD